MAIEFTSPRLRRTIYGVLQVWGEYGLWNNRMVRAIAADP